MAPCFRLSATSCAVRGLQSGLRGGLPKHGVGHIWALSEALPRPAAIWGTPGLQEVPCTAELQRLFYDKVLQGGVSAHLAVGT